ncbi:unnamed protein product [Anisakis simplex]|uniref:DNA-directed RNA polymerase III subunit n=1 Tax=Anisakis simplex TaxID=6269 RepID=A0A0M3JUT4_ANISI|nr:unnamed protein product [Anisakis simplex]
MSRGGRGGGRAAATAGVRAVASALGIARHEMNAFTTIVTEPPPLFPPLSNLPSRVKMNDEEQYQVELKQELMARFHESAFYMETETKKSDVRRYTDKYRNIEREKFKPNWNRLPKELRPKKRSSEKHAEAVKKKKKKKFNEFDKIGLEEKFKALEKKEVENVEGDEDGNAEEHDDDDGQSENEERNENEEQEVPSDDDYLEEDNDYVHSYFDNGENYGDMGSDDNIDDDNAY